MTPRFQTGLAAAAVLAATVATAAYAQMGDGMKGDRMQGNRGAMMLEMFDAIDADKNGTITEAEVEAHRLAQFAAADANSDGKLDAQELAAQQLARMTGMATQRAARMIENRDTDGDGAISAAEMDAPMQSRMFARMDADNDGAISRAEAEAAMERVSRRGKHRDGRGHGMGNSD